jgi:Asp-tRNA(Asn)/Glu-tRNA(Gln) amidotransferase A subunit family amidase
MDVCELSAAALAAALRRRELSAVDALAAVLERADAVAERLNPYALRLDDRARAVASAADASLARGEGGPLCGVPVTVKDSHWMAGIPTTHASRAVTGFVPRETVATVERLEAAGAVIYAKTTTPEFCYLGTTDSALHGRTGNPWNPERTPGGSSGGAAAALAAGAGPLALGGDGGGSIRIPAAFCGVVGFKPTFGAVAREPSAAGWKTIVAYGPLARSVADARLMLGCLLGWDARDRHSLTIAPLDAAAPARAVVSEDLGFAPLDADVREAFRAAIARLVDAGLEVVYDDPGLGPTVETWAAIATAEARWSEAEEYEQRPQLLTSGALEFLAAGDRVGAGQYIRAQMEREPIHRAYADLLTRTGASVLLTPTLGCEAFAGDRGFPATIGDVAIDPPLQDWGGFLYDANLAGLPACALPIGLGDEGLPLSLQVTGARGADGAVLAAAEFIETVLGFEGRVA